MHLPGKIRQPHSCRIMGIKMGLDFQQPLWPCAGGRFLLFQEGVAENVNFPFLSL